jgi:hypothetical protein
MAFEGYFIENHFTMRTDNRLVKFVGSNLVLVINKHDLFDSIESIRRSITDHYGQVEWIREEVVLPDCPGPASGFAYLCIIRDSGGYDSEMTLHEDYENLFFYLQDEFPERIVESASIIDGVVTDDEVAIYELHYYDRNINVAIHRIRSALPTSLPLPERSGIPAYLRADAQYVPTMFAVPAA